MAAAAAIITIPEYFKFRILCNLYLNSFFIYIVLTLPFYPFLFYSPVFGIGSRWAKKSHSPGREWLIKIFLVYSISLPFSQQIIAAAE
jgi:hypothetical protein